MPSKPVAVIDIGSNSIKVLVARRSADGQLEALKLQTEDARISAGISSTSPLLSPEGRSRGLDAIKTLLTTAAPFQPTQTILVATSAVRDAVNGGEFCLQIKEATGHEIRVLSGEEEANLIGRGLCCDPALNDLSNFYVFDLGGGSLECLAFQERQIRKAVSFPLGCVRLTESFIHDPSWSIAETCLDRIADHVSQSLKESSLRFDLPKAVAVFAGGSMTTVRALIGARQGIPFNHTPPVVETDTIERLLSEIAPLEIEGRKAYPGMPASRADVFPAALATMLAVARVAGVSRFTHSTYNLRWGLAARLLEV